MTEIFCFINVPNFHPLGASGIRIQNCKTNGLLNLFSRKLQDPSQYKNYTFHSPIKIIHNIVSTHYSPFTNRKRLSCSLFLLIFWSLELGSGRGSPAADSHGSRYPGRAVPGILPGSRQLPRARRPFQLPVRHHPSGREVRVVGIFRTRSRYGVLSFGIRSDDLFHFF